MEMDIHGTDLMTEEIDAPEADITCYRGKSILITGAGGSIGSELAQRLLSFKPKRIVLLELNEFALHSALMSLNDLADVGLVELVPMLGSVADHALVRHVLRSQAVDIVFHAAAYKHVPLVETNALVALSNNVLGTHMIATEAAKYGVERFVLISSDKAVRPTSVMGATKRMAEHVVQHIQIRFPQTSFGIVRFGNVIGSSGSVIPLFQDQVRKGGPVTLTDPRMIRYFMTAKDAVGLVLVAGSECQNADIFALDMGDPVAIGKVARDVVRASGKTLRSPTNPDGEIAIQIIGIRPGEKLAEEISYTRNIHKTRHPKILFVDDPRLPELTAAAMIRDLRAAIDAFDLSAALSVIVEHVGGYRITADEAPATRSSR